MEQSIECNSSLHINSKISWFSFAPNVTTFSLFLSLQYCMASTIKSNFRYYSKVTTNVRYDHTDAQMHLVLPFTHFLLS
jgi:hypothetical protein